MPVLFNADQDLRAITESIRQSAAAVELARVEDLAPLAQAVFNYVCDERGQGVKKLFSGATLEACGRVLDRPVAAEEVQKVAVLLLDENILARDGHGIYGVRDHPRRLKHRGARVRGAVCPAGELAGRGPGGTLAEWAGRGAA